jgi:hypothetical protein
MNGVHNQDDGDASIIIFDAVDAASIFVANRTVCVEQ